MSERARTKMEADAAGWTPRHIGDLYCSPFCGCGCTRAAYDRAVKEAEALAARMGEGWSVEISENGGWLYSVSKGQMTIRPTYAARRAADGGHIATAYSAWFEPAYIDLGRSRHAVQFIADAESPEDAVGFAVQDARSLVQRISDELAKVSA